MQSFKNYYLVATIPLSMYSRKALRFIGKVLGSDQSGGPRTKTRDEEHESDQEVLALR